MGLDASVRCRCWEDRLVQPPPFSIGLDADGWLEPTDDRDWEAFESWLGSCSHDRMEFASAYIGNWGGYRLFQEALRTLGNSRVPTLLRILPNSNGGTCPPAESKVSLAELSVFEKEYRSTLPVMVDGRTGEELMQHVSSYSGVFVLDGTTKLNIGLSPDGIFVVDRETGSELFRAMSIKQELEGSAGRRKPIARLTNLDTGEVFLSETPIPGLNEPVPGSPGKFRATYPELLRLEYRHRSSQDFAHTLAALRQVLSASVETGNPVRWC